MLTILSFLGVIFLIVIAATLSEVERFGWATITFLGSFFALQGLYNFGLLNFDLWNFIIAHKTYSSLFVPVYVLTGILWSFAKWASYLYKFKERFLEAKEEFLNKHSLPTTTVLDTEFFTEWDAKHKDVTKWTHPQRFFDQSLLKKPLASDNKRKIIFWMSLWPISFLGTLVNDPVRRFFNWCFRGLKATYQSISDHIFKDMQELK